MPKRTLDIRGFFAGLFQDHHDPQTPIEAQTGITTNIEVTRRNTVRLVKQAKALEYDISELAYTNYGILRWIKNLFLAPEPEILEYREGTENQFYTVEDVPSTKDIEPGGPNAPPLTPVVGAIGFNVDRDRITAQLSNLAVHLGVGNEPTNDPIWIGKYRHAQFGQQPDPRYHAAEALCRRPNLGDTVFEPTHKAVHVAGKIFTIDYNAEYINRFDNNGEFEDRALFGGSSHTAICEDRMTPGYILVYEAELNEVWRVNANLERISKMVVGGGEWTAPTLNLAVTDMEMSADRVYLGVMDTVAYTATGSFIYSFQYSSQAIATVTVVDVSFGLRSEDTVNFVTLDDPHGVYWYPLHHFYNEPDKTYQTLYDGGLAILQPGTWELTVSPIFLVPLANGYMGVLATPKYTGSYQFDWQPEGGAMEVLGASLTDEPGFFLTSDSTKHATSAVFRVHTNKSHMIGDNIRGGNIRAVDAQLWSVVPVRAVFGTTSHPYTSIQKITHEQDLYVVISRFEGTGTTYTRAYRYLVSDFMHNNNAEMGNVVIESEPYFIEGNLKYRLLEHGQFLLVFSPPLSTAAVWRKVATEGGAYVDDNNGEPVATAGTTMTAVLGSGDGGFVDAEAMLRLFYRCSFLYDGVQESSLSDRVVITGIEAADNEKPVEIIIKILQSVSRRVTHLNIYRAQSLISVQPEGFYRLVESIPLNTTFTAEDGKWVIPYTDRKTMSMMGPTFESSAGIPEGLRNTLPNYGLSAMINDRLYVADCWHPDVDDARLFLFRSNRYAVNIFNWPEENIRLPERPVAMEEFSNRLFVFTSSSCIVVNPEAMYVERVYDGIGALGAKCVAKTPAGLYVAGRNHAYLFTGADRQVLSGPIEARMQAKYDFNWPFFTQSALHSVFYNEDRQEVIFMSIVEMENPELSGTLIFAWHVGDRRWRREYHTGKEFSMGIPTAHGEAAVAAGAGLHWLNGSSLDMTETRIDNFNKVNSVYTRDIDFGDMMDHKWVYALKIRATDKNFEVFMNDVPLEKGITTEPMFYFKVPEQLRKQRSVRLRIRPKGAEIGQVSIIHRTKIIHAGKDF